MTTLSVTDTIKTLRVVEIVESKNIELILDNVIYNESCGFSLDSFSINEIGVISLNYSKSFVEEVA